jgi:DNA-directed RNA polymerase II subunit RPB2
MERDCVIAHGMGSFMYDSMMTRGDSYRMAICNQSGTIAVYNRETDSLFSPMVDGPISFEKIDNETFVPHLITKYGKEFSIVEVPYCFKLLLQELAAMQVHMRLITADNVESLTTLGKKSLGNLSRFTTNPIKEKKDSIAFERPESKDIGIKKKEVKEIKPAVTLPPITEALVETNQLDESSNLEEYKMEDLEAETTEGPKDFKPISLIDTLLAPSEEPPSEPPAVEQPSEGTKKINIS